MPEAPAPWQLFVQPDQRSCGAAAMVVARFLGDPAYRTLLEGGRPDQPAHAGRRLGAARAVQDRDARDAPAHHRARRRERQAADPVAPQVRHTALGGRPPALRAPSGRRRHARDVLLARGAHDLPGAYQRLLDAPRAGRVSALYVGTTWVPRHVALVVGATAPGTLKCTTPLVAGSTSSTVSPSSAATSTSPAGTWRGSWSRPTPERSSTQGPSARQGAHLSSADGHDEHEQGDPRGFPSRPRPVPRRAEPVLRR